MGQEREAELIGILRTAAWEADQRELGEVSRETPLDALELDSVSFMQVIAHFEDVLDRRLPNQAFARVRTVGEFFDVVEAQPARV
jgi:acyl carrier protein